MDNLDDIAWSIYSNPPLEKSCIQLQLEEETKEFIFKVLLELTMKGLRVLFGNDKNILDITKSEYNLLQKYSNSYGYKIVVWINGTQKTPWETPRELLFSYQLFFERI